MMQLIDDDRNGVIVKEEFRDFCFACIRERQIERDTDALAAAAALAAASEGGGGEERGAELGSSHRYSPHVTPCQTPVGSSRRLDVSGVLGGSAATLTQLQERRSRVAV
jgi:hypothetical protein